MSSTEERLSTADETGEEGSSTPMRMAAAYARKLRPSLSKHAQTGTMSGVTGGLTVLRGIRNVRRGKTGRGLARVAMGLVFVGIAVTQRRSARERSAAGNVDQSDVVSTAPDDLEAAATDDGAGVEHHEDVDEVVDTGADIDGVDPDERSDDLGEGDVDEREVADTGTDAADVVEESEEAGTPDGSGAEGSDGDETETVDDDVGAGAAGIGGEDDEDDER